ncbi:hypothetical protein SAMN04487949_0700 [Halogranum gelatinilyticum]|uniref:Uncharacterized protein n=1 Tax=Halogranum gelatinilyticum TaxID=660521 RepID=A0A1G9Q5L7_9EURY|nr:hypothetical protein [Halogranum gelatinilyticum]SDM06342.1 hypothetical protein SAMN04487949_0700 [Halogranum gelatinilyticum]
MERAAALDRVETIVDTVASEPMAVPIREVWVYGDVALGLDPIERLDVYVTKDLMLRGDGSDEQEARFETEYGVKGVGKSVSADWAEQFPDHLRANDNGYAAPEKCLAAHLVDDSEPIHLEVCNASFEDNVTQRLRGAVARDAYEQILDPRGVCLWMDGTYAEETMAKLRGGELPFPTLSGALEMLGLEEEKASEAADAMRQHRAEQTGSTVRGDVI